VNNPEVHRYRTASGISIENQRFYDNGGFA
jgi:hypothetical protein